MHKRNLGNKAKVTQKWEIVQNQHKISDSTSYAEALLYSDGELEKKSKQDPDPNLNNQTEPMHRELK